MPGALLYYVAKGDVQGITETLATAKDVRVVCIRSLHVRNMLIPCISHQFFANNQSNTMQIDVAFRLACKMGHKEVFAELLSIVDAAGRSIPSSAYDAIIAYDCLDMLLMLMKRLNGETKDVFIKNMLRNAAVEGATEIFKYFYEISGSDFDSVSDALHDFAIDKFNLVKVTEFIFMKRMLKIPCLWHARKATLK
jgi:hypothetical protein